MNKLFISDLHLATENPQVLRLCLELLEKEKQNFDSLYILGDLFDFWFGDDAVPPGVAPLMQSLRRLSDSGKSLYFLQGNRDFLVGEAFCQQIGCTLLPDVSVIDFCGEPTLIMHGDLLCTDDHDYFKFRAYVHDPERQRQYLALPIAERIAQARAIQVETKQASKAKSTEIMDANANTIADFFLRHKVTRMIHGHTHRPAVHHLQIDNRAAQRIVLGDWHDQPSYLLASSREFVLCDPRVEPTRYSARMLDHIV